MRPKYRYPNRLYPNESFEKQIQDRPYAENDLSSTIEHAKRVGEKYGVGAGGTHALLAAGSKPEREAIALILGRLQPLRLYDVETTQKEQNPKRAVLFGVARKDTPVVVCLQAKRPYKDTDRGGCDLFITGLYPHLKYRTTAVRPRVVEFDFHPDHRTPSGRIDDYYRNMRARWEDKGADPISVRNEPDGKDWRDITRGEIFAYKRDLEADVRRLLSERKAAFQQVIQRLDKEVDENLGDLDFNRASLIGNHPKKDPRELFIDDLTSLDSEKFQNSLRGHCESCYALKRFYSGVNRAEVEMTVTEKRASIDRFVIGPREEGNWPEKLKE